MYIATGTVQIAAGTDHLEVIALRASTTISHSPIIFYYWEKNALQQFPIHIPFPNNYWDVLIFNPLSSQIKGGFMLSQYVIVLGQEYWETAKATPSIILKLLLRHLPIPVSEK